MDAQIVGLWVNTIDRIMARFVVKTETCWIWQGKKDYGYGRVGMNGTHHRAHRLIYEALKGPIPEGLQLDHLCRNRSCVNPNHLEPVTGAQNCRRGIGSKTHCKHGHEFTEENTYSYLATRTGNPARGCKICRRTVARESKRKLRLAYV